MWRRTLSCDVVVKEGGKKSLGFLDSNTFRPQIEACVSLDKVGH